LTPELFAQISTAIGGPGAVVFLWWYMSRPGKPENKVDAAKSAAEDIEAIKDIMHRLESKVDILLDRGNRK
jgi:hypothetical protein